MPSAKRLVPAAGPPPADAATRRIPKAAAPAASLSSGLWPLSLLANTSMLAMGSTLPLEMSSRAVPTVMSRPLLVGTLVDLVFGGPLLAQSAKSFGSCTVFRCLKLATLLPLSSYESSLSTELIWRHPPPFGGCVRLLQSRWKSNDTSPPRAFLRGVPPTISSLLFEDCRSHYVFT